MIHFKRPPEPAGFRERTREARSAVEQAVDAEELPVFDDRLWQAYKPIFFAAQHGKCAYCEAHLGTHDSHLDHFAPKSEVWELSLEAVGRGREIEPGLPNIQGRRPARKDRGYWWLAYEWSNYLAVCAVCNSKWKQCYFPVAAAPRCLPPAPDVPEQPLLLNAFDDHDPWRHFRFTEFGGVVEAAESKHGRATIETCGLDRESLRLIRVSQARNAHAHARKLMELLREDSKQSRDLFTWVLESLCELGGDERPHAGMVRGIAEQITGMPWAQLLELEAASRDATSADAGDAAESSPE